MNRQQLLYSTAATRRILNLPDNVPVRVQEFHRVIWVWVSGRRPTFISKAIYHQHFVDFRRQTAKPLLAYHPSGDWQDWTVINPDKGTSYRVKTCGDKITCTCEDYHNQVHFLGRGCCKHGYAVLATLGFSSLRDFLNFQAK
jgi:hypothetical protein